MNCFFCQNELVSHKSDYVCDNHPKAVHYVCLYLLAYVMITYNKTKYQVVWYFDRKILKILPPFDSGILSDITIPEAFETTTPDNIQSKLPLLLNFS